MAQTINRSRMGIFFVAFDETFTNMMEFQMDFPHDNIHNENEEFGIFHLILKQLSNVYMWKSVKSSLSLFSFTFY